MSELTVVVAIYNVEQYLRSCLSSLSKQSCQDYEVFCVNDGSTDGSRDIILEYVEKYPNFRLLDKKNGGLSDARNFGLERCQSTYISFVDGDDFVSEDYVEKGLKRMKETGADMLVFAYEQYYLAENRSEKIGLSIAEGTYRLKDKKELLAYTPNAAWNKIYKRSLFIDNEIRYPYGYRHQDLGTTPKLLLKAESVAYYDEALYHYLIDRPGNITAQIDKKLYHILDMSKEVLNYYIREKEYDNYVDEFEYLISRNCIQSLRKAVTLKDKAFVHRFIDDVFALRKQYFKKSTHHYKIVEEKSDTVYNSKILCKLYYAYKNRKG